MELFDYSAYRNKLVIKANDLIQKTRFDLSLQQLKIVLFLIAQIEPKDEDFKTVEFNIPDFCRVCGIDPTSGGNYQKIKAAIKALADRSVWIDIDGTETLVRWIEKPRIHKKSGTISLRLDEDMKPFLLHLRKNFTVYELLWVLRFQRKYSIRLYELAKSYHYRELETYTKRFDVEVLKFILEGENYPWGRFKQFILDPCIEEINRFSDKTISYTTVKKGRSIAYVDLHLGTKEPMEIIKLRSDIEHELGLDQLSLWDVLEEKGYV